MAGRGLAKKKKCTFVHDELFNLQHNYNVIIIIANFLVLTANIVN